MIAAESAAREWCAGRYSADIMAKLDQFVALLRFENSQQNLVSKASLEHVWQRHIVDSLQLLDHVPRGTLDGGLWLDLGSGAGLPGLPVALACPDLEIWMIESRKRRIEWLAAAVKDLALPNCHVVGSRLELVETRAAAVISARAFAPLGKLIDLSARFSTRSTLWLLPKGRSGAQELSEQPRRIRNMFHVEQSLTDPEAAILVGKGSPHSP